MDVEVDHVLDVKGEACPMPVIKTKQKLDDVGEGEVLKILSTDPGAEPDIKSLANRVDLDFLGIEEDGDVLSIYVRK